MRQKGLFPAGILTEENIENLISPYYPDLWSMIRAPFDDLVTRRANDACFRILDDGDAAQWLRPQIIEKARQAFDGHPTVKVQRRRQQLFINIDNQIAVTPKKLRDRWMGKGLTFSAYKTKQNKQYWKQEQIDGIPNLPRIIVGYQFMAEMTDIRIWVAYPYGRYLRECFLMPDQHGNIIGEFIPIVHPGEDDGKGFEVKPKKDSKELG